MGNRTSCNIGPPKGSSVPVDDSLRSQYKRALARVPASKVPRIRRIFDELRRQSSTSGERVDKASFLRYFPLPGMMGERLFAVFDKDGNGSIEFPEFLTGLSLIYHGSMDDKRKFLFDMYDLDGNGEVTKDELLTMLSYIPAAFRILALHDPDEVTTASAVATYKPRKDVEDKIKKIVDSVFESKPSGGKSSTLSFEEFQVAIARNSAISEIINIFYDDGLPENEFVGDQPSAPNDILDDSSNTVSAGISRHPSDVQLNTLTPSQRCKCPLCETVIQFVHCIRCGGLLAGNRLGSVGMTAADLQASRCMACGYRSPEPRHCFACGHPLKSSLDQRECGSTDMEEDMPESAEDVPSSTDPTPTATEECRGVLFKIGKATHSRQSRFFVLKDSFLYYYLREPVDESLVQPRGVIFLSGLVVSAISSGENSVGKFGFMLKSGSRKRVFYAQTAVDQLRWVAALRRASKTRSIHDFYTIDLGARPIGQGKFSIVYAATSKASNESVAVKVLTAADAGADEDREFLRTELAIVKLVSHPNIVRTLDVFESVDKIFIVMERVHGGDLLSKLQADGRMSEFEGKRTVFAIVTAIKYLHEQSIIHRDIKPENILLSDHGVVKVTDFGLSAVVPHTRTLEAPLGTVGYAAPEVLLSIPYDKSVDMWSLGAVTYVILSGQMPFKGNSDQEIAASVLKGRFSLSANKCWADVSETGKNFIQRLLVKDPSKRMTASEALQHEWLRDISPLVHTADESDNAERAV